MPLIEPYDTPPGYDPDEVRIPDASGLSYEDRKKGNELQRLMILMAGKIAPEEIREHDLIAPFISANDLKGTNLEVIVARAYQMAMYKGDISAMKFIKETIEGNKAANAQQLVINFISPSVEHSREDEEHAELMASDNWTVKKPAEVDEPGPSALE